MKVLKVEIADEVKECPVCGADLKEITKSGLDGHQYSKYLYYDCGLKLKKMDGVNHNKWHVPAEKCRCPHGQPESEVKMEEMEV